MSIIGQSLVVDLGHHVWGGGGGGGKGGSAGCNFNSPNDFEQPLPVGIGD